MNMTLKVRQALQQLPDKDLQRLKVWVWLLAAVLVVMLNLWPALQSYQQAPLQLAKLETQTQALKHMQAQAKALQNAPRINAAEARAILQQMTTDALGNGAKLSTDGTLITLTVSSASAEALAQWLAAARTQAQALPVEAHLQKSSGSSKDAKDAKDAKEFWRGSIILSLPSRSS
jgi:general secretion pathway protein M